LAGRQWIIEDEPSLETALFERFTPADALAFGDRDRAGIGSAVQIMYHTS